MEKHPFLTELEQRAYAARLPIYKVCLRAGVAPATISNWRKAKVFPNASTIGKLEDALAAIEAERRAA
jgi:transcriptional regulator with XRE-family HTH domain